MFGLVYDETRLLLLGVACQRVVSDFLIYFLLTESLAGNIVVRLVLIKLSGHLDRVFGSSFNVV